MTNNVKIFNRIDGSRVRLVFDEEYVPMYCLDSEDETQAAIEHENAMLRSCEWIVLGAILEKQCPTCEHWHAVDSVWGIVVENNEKGLAEAAEQI
jgi:hypothetical protein